MSRFFSACILTALLASSAWGQTAITGHHDGNTTGTQDGLDVTAAGTYLINADAGTVLDATFSNNGGIGLNVTSTGAMLTVAGGQFSHNGAGGLAVSGPAVISGGVFDNNNGVGFKAQQGGTTPIVITGGDFSADIGGISAAAGPVAVYGGNVTGDVFDFAAADRLDIYGTFNGMSPGQTTTLSGIGTFIGRLQDNATPLTYNYTANTSMITLHDTPVPEPAVALPLVILAVPIVLQRDTRRRPIEK